MRAHEQGGILILVIIVMAVLLLFSLSFYLLTSTQVMQTTHQEHFEKANVAAESAAICLINQARATFQSNMVAFVSAWNDAHPGIPIFDTNPTNIKNRYIQIVQAAFNGFGDPLSQAVHVQESAFDEKGLTDLDAYMVVDNGPITLNGSTPIMLGSFANNYNIPELVGDVSIGGGGFSFTMTIPYRIFAQGGTEKSGTGEYGGSYRLVEQGHLVQSFPRRILNQWVLCTDMQKNRESGTSFNNEIWFTNNTNFRGPVHTNDHFNIFQTPCFTHSLTCANQIFNYPGPGNPNVWQGYVPYGNGLPWGAGYDDIADYCVDHQSYYQSNYPIVAGNPSGYETLLVAYSASVDFPENTLDQKGIAQTGCTNCNSATHVVIPNNGGQVTGGIYAPGDVDALHCDVVKYSDIPNWPYGSSAMHDQMPGNLDNGFFRMEFSEGRTVTQIIIQDEYYSLGGMSVNNEYTYYRQSADGGASWSGWQRLNGVPNGVIYIDGDLGYADMSGDEYIPRSGEGLSGIISGNLTPRDDGYGNIIYASDNSWNITVNGDVFIDGNILYSYYGRNDAITYDDEPDGFTGYGVLADPQHGFYSCDDYLYVQDASGYFIHRNMLGILTAKSGANIYINPKHIPTSDAYKRFYLDGFMFTADGMIEVLNYGDHSSKRWYDQGPVTLRGGYLEHLYGAHGQFGSLDTGFGRDFQWDLRAEQIAPPAWPIEQKYKIPSFLPARESIVRRPIKARLAAWPPDAVLFHDTLSNIY